MLSLFSCRPVGRHCKHALSSVRGISGKIPFDFAEFNTLWSYTYHNRFMQRLGEQKMLEKISAVEVKTEIHFDGAHDPFEADDMGMYTTSTRVPVHIPHRGFTHSLIIHSLADKNSTTTVEMELLTELTVGEPFDDTWSWTLKGIVSCDRNGRITDAKDFYIDPKKDYRRYLERMDEVDIHRVEKLPLCVRQAVVSSTKFVLIDIIPGIMIAVRAAAGLKK